jgi:superfamily II DNA or RNA helicase
MLRDYQIKSKDGILASLKKGHKRVIFCLPTGGGKTVTFADIVAGATAKGKTVMILCDRKELLTQAYNKVKNLGLIPTIIAPGHAYFKSVLYLASVDSLRRRDSPIVDIIIVDEAHKQTFDKVLQEYIGLCDPIIIGATATPLRTGSQNALTEIYTDIVNEVSVQDLIDKNFLVPAKTYAAKKDFSDVARKGLDFDVSALYSKYNTVELYDNAVENYKRFADNKKMICFNVNVEHSLNMRDAFLKAGISAQHLDGNTSDFERKNILKGFAKGDFRILCNCSVLTTGFDEPSADGVIINRATLSLALWLQMCGRGSRLFENKDHFIIIDQGANVYRHGLWEQDRTWSIHKKKQKKEDGVAPIKLCPACEAINNASATKCKACDFVFERKEKELKNAVFVEITTPKRVGFLAPPDPKVATMQEMQDYAKEKGYKPGWAYKQMQFAKRV